MTGYSVQSVGLSPHQVRAARQGRISLIHRVLAPPYVKFFAGQGPLYRPSRVHLAVATAGIDGITPAGDGPVWSWLAASSQHDGQRSRWLAQIEPAVGDRLWVRESWAGIQPGEAHVPLRDCKIEYRADLPDGCNDYPGQWPAEEARDNLDAPKWRVAKHMPRWASRMTLRVTGVAVLRLQGLTEVEAIDAGALSFPAVAENAPLQRFRQHWDRMHTLDPWDTNPVLVALSFGIEHRNIDAQETMDGQAREEVAA